MAQISKTLVDNDLRNRAFADLIINGNGEFEWSKINDRQYGVIMVDANGVERYVRIGAIVAELREDMTARELMQSEMDTYNEKQNAKAEKAKEKAEKIARDQRRRAEKAAEKAAKEGV